MDQQGAQAALDHGLGIVGVEARSFVEEEQISQAVPHDHLVEGAQEQLAGLRGAHPHLQAVARGIVEEEQRHSAQTRRAGAEMLAVGEHALHALGILPAPRVCPHACAVAAASAGPSAGTRATRWCDRSSGRPGRCRVRVRGAPVPAPRRADHTASRCAGRRPAPRSVPVRSWYGYAAAAPGRRACRSPRPRASVAGYAR